MGALEDYINRKNGEKAITYIHPDMEPILKKTYGCMIYQEQLMDVVRKFGGRSYGGADKFRKAIGKKNIELVKEESEKLLQTDILKGLQNKSAMISKKKADIFSINRTLRFTPF